MLKALNSGLTAISAQQTALDLVANNIANVNTTGYKEAKPQFADLVYQQVREDKPAVQAPLVGQGARVGGIQSDFSQGTLVQTGRSLDLAIAGSGFLKVKTPDGEVAYTRNGNLQIDSSGSLIAGGAFLDPQIIVPIGSELKVAEDGQISVTDLQQGITRSLGRIELVNFKNPQGLAKIGESLYQATADSGAPVAGIPGSEGFGIVQSGYLENSNVDLANAMNAMLQAQRAYQLNSRVISSADQMLGLANNLRR